MKRAVVAVSLVALALACKSGGDGGKSKPAASGGPGHAVGDPAAGSKSGEPDEPAKKDPDKPRGWKAYTGERITDTEGVAAVDATVDSHDGKSLKLSETWKDGYSVLVFYRGHW